MKRGVRGWLLFYVIGPGVLGSLMILAELMAAKGAWYQGYCLTLLSLNVYGVYLIYTSRTTFTRKYHQWFNGGVCAFNVLVMVTVIDDYNAAVSQAGAALGVLIWWLYWIRSRRVKMMYTDLPSHLVFIDD